MDHIVIDTNPLVYIYHGTPKYGRTYAALLGNLSINSYLTIPHLVYGELSVLFGDEDALNLFLSDTGIVIGEMAKEAYAFAAGRWTRYHKKRVFLRQRCGHRIGRMLCPACGAEIQIRQHILTDFLIGAFAYYTKGRRIVTHDKGTFSTYFPELEILSAEPEPAA